MASRWWTAALVAAVLATGMPAVAAAEGVSPEAATEQQKENARAFFTTALEAHQDKRFEEALEGFRRSYAAVASPNSHLMIARTLRSMGRLAEAYEELGQVAKEAEAAAKTDEKYGKTADAARADREALAKKIGFVRVVGTERASEQAQLSVGGRAIRREAWSQPIPVTPGPVVVHLLGQPPKEVEVQVGASVEVDVTPPAVPPPDVEPSPEDEGYSGPDRRTMAFVAGGIGAAGIVTYAIFGSLALATYDDIDSQCVNQVCPAELSEEADRGRIYQAVANVGFVVGIVGLATGAGLLAWDILDEDSTGEEEPHRPEVAVGPGHIQARVSF